MLSSSPLLYLSWNTPSSNMSHRMPLCTCATSFCTCPCAAGTLASTRVCDALVLGSSSLLHQTPLFPLVFHIELFPSRVPLRLAPLLSLSSILCPTAPHSSFVAYEVPFSPVTLRALNSLPSHKTLVSLFLRCFSSRPHYMSKQILHPCHTQSPTHHP